MSLVSINPTRRTKISDGACTIKANNNTYIIHVTDEDKSVLATSYANSLVTIDYDGEVYAQSTKYSMDIEVVETNPKPVIKKESDKEVKPKATSRKKKATTKTVEEKE